MDAITFILGGIGALVALFTFISSWLKIKHDHKWKEPFDTLKTDLIEKIYKLDNRISVLENSVDHVISQLDDIKHKVEANVDSSDKDIDNLYEKIEKLTNTLIDYVRDTH